MTPHLHDAEQAFGFHCLTCNAIVPAYGDPATQRCPECVAAGVVARAPVADDDHPAHDKGGNFVCGWGGKPPCSTRLERRGLCDDHTAQLRALVSNHRDAADRRADGRTAYAERRAEEARQRTQEKADAVAAFVLGADSYPVPRKALAEALGDGQVLSRAIERVTAEREDVVWFRGRPAQTGFYLRGEQPQRRSDPLTPEQKERQRAAHRERRPSREEVEEAARVAGVPQAA